MHIRSVLEEHTVGGFGVGPEGAAETPADPLEGVVSVWAAVIVNVVDLVGITLYPELEGAEEKAVSLSLRRPDADAADIRDASVQKRSRRNGILRLDAPLVAGFDVAEGEAPAVVGGGFVVMRVVSGGDTVPTVKMLVPATKHSKSVFNEQRPMPDRVREEAV